MSRIEFFSVHVLDVTKWKREMITYYYQLIGVRNLWTDECSSYSMAAERHRQRLPNDHFGSLAPRKRSRTAGAFRSIAGCVIRVFKVDASQSVSQMPGTNSSTGHTRHLGSIVNKCTMLPKCRVWPVVWPVLLTCLSSVPYANGRGRGHSSLLVLLLLVIKNARLGVYGPHVLMARGLSWRLAGSSVFIIEAISIQSSHQ